MDAVEKAKNNPGPGAYDIEKSGLKKNAGFTFGLGYKKDKVYTSAGPGSYDIQSSLKTTSGFTFPRSARSNSA